MRALPFGKWSNALREIVLGAGRRLRRSVRQRWELSQWLRSLSEWPAPEERVNYGAFEQIRKGSDVMDPDARYRMSKMFCQDILDALKRDIILDRDIDNPIGQIVIDGTNYRNPRARRLRIASGPMENVIINDLEVNEMIVQTSRSEVRIKNCRIRSLIVYAGCPRITIENCLLGELRVEWTKRIGPAVEHLPDLSIGAFDLIGSFIHSFRMSNTQAFHGNARVVRTAFDRRPVEGHSVEDWGGLEQASPQDYRNARINLAACGNQRAAGAFHATELSLESKTYPWGANRLLSCGYEMMADFGNSLARPAGWFLGLVGAGIAIVYVANAAVPVPMVGGSVHSWQAGLVRSGPLWRLIRSILLEFRYIRNPLAFLSSQGLVAADAGWISGVLVVQSLFGLISLALLIIAVRRQFKLS